LIIADSALPVPPPGYGGTERIVSYLADELAQRGHQITLMAREGSRSPGRLVTYSDRRNQNKMVRGWAKWRFHRMLRKELPQHDLVHSVARLDYVFPALQSQIPKILSFHNPLTFDQVDYIQKYGKGRIIQVACGDAMIGQFRAYGQWQTVHNCVDLEHYPFRPMAAQPPYLAFLARITRYKGLLDAVQVARQSGLPLRIGGNVGTMGEDAAYFRDEVQPLIDGRHIQYLGELDDQGKIELLGGATALLNPILWDEPFGIVSVESLACGTPILSYPRGELPAIIRDGVTGFLCKSVAEMARRVGDLESIKRWNCRRDAESRFSIRKMVDKIESLYRQLFA
jgi:glycosyltransferase involved in cell wall biosynthesis